MFFWPLCRDISLALGGVDAGRHIADKVLNAKLSLMVYPGGSEEIFLTEPNSTETRLVVNKRFGFIKLAMRHGTPLVPVAVFNERDAYHKLSAPESVRSWFLQTLKVPLLVFWCVVVSVGAAAVSVGCVVSFRIVFPSLSLRSPHSRFRPPRIDR